MNDFDYDVRQKKDIARSAAHRVCGSKSRKCSLPSDGLSKAQIESMHGDVQSYNLSRPMDWRTFRGMPEDLQKEYIRKLQEDFRVTDGMLGEMFSKSPATIQQLRTALSVRSLGKSNQPGKADRDRFRRFFLADAPEIEGSIEDGTPQLDTDVQEPEPAPTAEKTPGEPVTDLCGVKTWDDLAERITRKAIAPKEELPADAPKVIPNPLKSFHAEFQDIHNWEEFYALLKQFPEPGAGSSIQIYVRTADIAVCGPSVPVNRG